MRLRFLTGGLLAWCALLGGGASVSAQQPSLEDYYQLQQHMAAQEARLRQLEQERWYMTQGDPGLYQVNTSNLSYNNALERRLAELEEAVLGNGKKEDGCQPANDKPTQKWTGRIHFDYWPFPDDSPLIDFLETGDPDTPPQDFIGFRRLRLGLNGDITATMLYKIEFDFASPDSMQIKDAYLGWQELPYLQTVLLGNQKRPYGLDHLNSSRYNVFMERPFIVEAYNQDARRVGLCSYGVSEDEAWNWRYGYYIMNDLQNIGSQYADNYQSEIAGRVANTIWYDESSDGRGYAHWAVSGTAAFPGGGNAGRFRTRPEARTDNRWIDTGSGAAAFWDTYQLIGCEGVVNIGALSVVGEYQASQVQRVAGLPNLDFDGYYVYVAYFLTGEHTPWERASGTLGRTVPFENFFVVDRCGGGTGHGWGAWQVAARYSHGDFTDQEIFGGVGTSFTFGLNWWWTPYSRLQFNYINGQIDERANADTIAAGLPLSGNYNIFGTRFMVDF